MISRLNPHMAWSLIPDAVRESLVATALDVPDLSLREFATRFIDTECFSSRKRCIAYSRRTT